jgi:hypothetical protein
VFGGSVKRVTSGRRLSVSERQRAPAAPSAAARASLSDDPNEARASAVLDERVRVPRPRCLSRFPLRLESIRGARRPRVSSTCRDSRRAVAVSQATRWDAPTTQTLRATARRSRRAPRSGDRRDAVARSYISRRRQRNWESPRARSPRFAGRSVNRIFRPSSQFLISSCRGRSRLSDRPSSLIKTKRVSSAKEDRGRGAVSASSDIEVGYLKRIRTVQASRIVKVIELGHHTVTE